MGALDLFKLDGKVALVTGAGSGLGRAYPEALADPGADPPCVDLDLTAAAAGAARLRAPGRRGGARGWARSTWPLPTRGGAETRQPILEAPLERGQRVIDAALTSVFLTARGAARQMIPRGAGKIVSTASIIGFVSVHDGGQTRA